MTDFQPLLKVRVDLLDHNENNYCSWKGCIAQLTDSEFSTFEEAKKDWFDKLDQDLEKAFAHIRNGKVFEGGVCSSPIEDYEVKETVEPMNKVDELGKLLLRFGGKLKIEPGVKLEITLLTHDTGNGVYGKHVETLVSFSTSLEDALEEVYDYYITTPRVQKALEEDAK